ncbi:MAG: hypothetical protein J7M25_01720 [Deltaproteobacteria bacterium]|nr:hypothetical protein [Deltaproteobacteria bacterium]
MLAQGRNGSEKSFSRLCRVEAPLLHPKIVISIAFVGVVFGSWLGAGCALVDEEAPVSGSAWCDGPKTCEADPSACMTVDPDWRSALAYVRPALHGTKRHRRGHVAVGPASQVACSRGAENVLVLPLTPSSDRFLSVIAVGHDGRLGRLTVYDDKGLALLPDRKEQWGRQPRAELLHFRSVRPGRYRAYYAMAGSNRKTCLEFTVRRSRIRPGAKKAKPGMLDDRMAALRRQRAPATGVWKVRRVWTPAMEDLYSAFIAHTFLVAGGQIRSWHRLIHILRNPRRNLLFDALGLAEESSGEAGVRVMADCADAPYVLRAYFSWKLGLPFAFHRCTRGNSIAGPKCSTVHSNLDPQFDRVEDPVERFNRLVWMVINSEVHSGNPRTLPDDDNTDFYPVALTKEGLRPGTIFVDAGGHVITVSQVRSQRPGSMGMLFGVDAHPDMTVTRKMFGPGTFVFNHHVRTDGFKAFRPVIYEQGRMRFMTNAELRSMGWSPRISDEQAEIHVAHLFYHKVLKVFNPKPIDPYRGLVAKVESFYQATLERVEAIELGQQFMAERGWARIPMPDGRTIFQTVGPWEAYSTPARDLRYLKALDDLLKFPRTVMKDRDLYLVPKGTDRHRLAHELVRRLAMLLKQRTFAYRRSDRTKWKLSLADVVARQQRLEMAYNPNDCPEIRWGARRGSGEAMTCSHRATRHQHAKMGLVRQWFAERYRPDG